MAVLGALVLVSYGFVPTAQPVDNFGRVFAVYGGFFIILSYLWGWAVDGDRPDTGVQLRQRRRLYLWCCMAVRWCHGSWPSSTLQSASLHARFTLQSGDLPLFACHICVSRVLKCSICCGDRRLDWQRHCTGGRRHSVVLAPLIWSAAQRSVIWFVGSVSQQPSSYRRCGVTAGGAGSAACTG